MKISATPHQHSTHLKTMSRSKGSRTPRRKPLVLEASAPHSHAFGDGLNMALVGSAASFVVQGCDAGGLPVDEGMLAPQLSISLAGPAPATHTLEPLADGSVRVWFTPVLSGRYLLKVLIHSQPLPGSPFEVLAAPRSSGSPRRADSAPKRGGAKSPRNPRLMAKDVRLRWPQGAVAFYATAGQRARFTVHSPFGGYLRPGDASRFACVLHLKQPWVPAPDGSSSSARAGERIFRGRVCAPPGGQCLQATAMAGGEGWAGSDASGELECYFSLEVAGVFWMHVSLDGEHVGGSPALVRVAPAAVDPLRCMVEGRGTMEAEAGQLSTLTLHLFDAYGNRRSHADAPVLTRVGAALQLISAHGDVRDPNPHGSGVGSGWGEYGSPGGQPSPHQAAAKRSPQKSPQKSPQRSRRG